jgi:endo-1,4-beta-xylanase
MSLSRRSFLAGAAGAVAAGLVGCTPDKSSTKVGARPSPTLPAPDPVACADGSTGGPALWETALERGIVYGSSTATWQTSDPEYRRLYARESAILFTEDDLLWYRLLPKPEADLDFSFGDKMIGFAEKQGMLSLATHLVWDEGFGEGWTTDDLWSLNEKQARDLLFTTIEREVNHYKGRVTSWIVANEVLDGNGMRVDVPWFATIGASYVTEAFRLANQADPDAFLLLNDYGYETDDDTSLATDKQARTLELLDQMLADGVPVHGLGIQAHLQADRMSQFDAVGYRRFLKDVADRDLKILITEMDVLDDGLPRDIPERDAAVADTYRSYLEVALDEPAVVSLITFGLSDRYTWLEEDFPRDDGVPRRPLLYDEDLKPKLAYEAVATSLQNAPAREPLWVPPRCKA